MTTRPIVARVIERAVEGWIEIDHEVVVHEPSTARTHVLDPTASLLWQCLDAERPLNEIFGDIADAFAVETHVIARDCLPVIDSWLDANIARPVDATNTPTPVADHLAGSWRRPVDPPDS